MTKSAKEAKKSRAPMLAVVAILMGSAGAFLFQSGGGGKVETILVTKKAGIGLPVSFTETVPSNALCRYGKLSLAANRNSSSSHPCSFASKTSPP